MKRLVVLAVVILNMIFFPSAIVTSTRANTGSPVRMVKLGSIAINPGAELNLDFTLVNKTGYDISALYIGPSSNKDWTDDMEILHGKNFPDGATLEITFHPKAKAEKWDIMVEWADDYENDEWLGLKLTEINKVTLTYNRKANETRAIVE
jgi:hypothetical protein